MGGNEDGQAADGRSGGAVVDGHANRNKGPTPLTLADIGTDAPLDVTAWGAAHRPR
ncbi:hypothetical protein ACO0M4_31675 [Streptomyces sp. RGM 3693]|uniref:hypothetical protein n=1 Tax=Streptomyces sp. RGM 3693 TaxID=3413284 RepID=UPI003D2E02A2